MAIQLDLELDVVLHYLRAGKKLLHHFQKFHMEQTTLDKTAKHLDNYDSPRIELLT